MGNAREWSWAAKLIVLAVAAATAVSVIYLPQAMLTVLAARFGVAPAAAGVIATSVQAGYAIGIFLLVPLADRVQPRRQVTIQSVLLAAALAVTAVLPEIVGVTLGFLAVGLVANIAQILIPAASRLAPKGKEGAALATVAGALLIGIFGGRIIASLLVQTIGWRWVVLSFAVLVLAVLPFLRTALATELELHAAGGKYRHLLASTLQLSRRSPELIQSALMQFFVFATFNSLWTVTVLHLTGPGFGWSVLSAGLFGAVGLAAGIATPFSGRFVDRFGPLPVGLVFLLVLLLGVLSVIIDPSSAVLFGASMFVITWANQTILSANQARTLAANPVQSAQANTVFMFAVFLGGSAGAFTGTVAFSAGGMPLVGVQAGAFVLIALVIWFASATHQKRTTPNPGKKGITA